MTLTPKTGLLADLFCGPGNLGWELGRIMGFLAFLPMVAALIHNIKLGEAIPLDALGTGIGAIYLGIAILIAGKDWARSNAISTAKQDATAAVTAVAEAKVPEAQAEAIVAATEGTQP